MKYAAIIVSVPIALLNACGSDDPDSAAAAGAEGGACYGNGTCDVGLVCSGSNICVQPNDEPCLGVSCSDQGTCVAQEGAPQCNCDPGFTANGLECVEADPCQWVTCTSHGVCQNNAGTPECECDAGYHAEGLDCLADAPCEAPDVCSGHGHCVMQGQLAECICEAGYQDVGLRCIKGAHRIHGTVVITQNPDEIDGNPSTDAFDPIEGVPIRYSLVFDVDDIDYYTSGLSQHEATDIDSSSATLVFDGGDAAVMSELNASFAGVPLSCTFDGPSTTMVSCLINYQGSSTVMHYESTISGASQDFPVNEDGYPALLPFVVPGASMGLTRHDTVRTDLGLGEVNMQYP